MWGRGTGGPGDGETGGLGGKGIGRPGDGGTEGRGESIISKYIKPPSRRF